MSGSKTHNEAYWQTKTAKMEFQCQKLFTDVVDIFLWCIFSFGVDLDNDELYKPTTLVDKIFTPETHLHFKRVYMKLFF